MRSLFVKIFVWFWLAMALVVLAHSVSTMMVFDETPKRMLEGEVAMYGLAAAEKYEREGKAGADDYFNLLERTKRTRAYLFDESGNEIAGKDAPPKVREAAQMTAVEGEDKFIQTAGTDFMAKKTYAPSGKQFIIVGERPRPTGIRLPFWPRVWWAQLIAVLLTTGVVCYLLARYFSSPVVKLRAATQQLAAGDLSARVGAANGKRRDELADLGRDFDIMAERIQSLMNSQRRLLHDISHELRSPLARLKIALELARERDGEEAEWAFDRIEREADRLQCRDDGEAGQAVVSVLDKGAGVPQAALADIFRPFYRVADARDRQSGGVGLGLSISRRAVQVHGGAVTASNAPGGGLLVEIHLPILN